MSAICNKRNFLKRLLSIALAIAIILSVPGMATAAGRTALNKKKLTLKIAKSAVLKLKNNKKKTTWKVVSGKNRISIVPISKNSIRVWGISKGKAVVQAKAGKKKYRCKITVKDSGNNGTNWDSSYSTPKPPSTPKPKTPSTSTPNNPSTPSTSPSSSPTPAPGSVEGPSLSGLIGQSAELLEQQFGVPVRIDSAPQGFDSYIYNPNGNYSAYMIVGVRDNVVVSCFTISRGFTYGDYVMEGEDTSVLPSRGWGISANSNETGGYPIYQITLANETAYAYHDRHGSGQVYGILIISNDMSPSNFFSTCQGAGYTPDMLSDIETEIIELTNAFRVYNGLAALKEDGNADTAARLHSQDMAANAYCAHESLDGRSPYDRMRNAGVSFSTAGENIARGQADAASLVNGWISSEGHRNNILNSRYEYIGCGCGFREGDMWNNDWYQQFDMLYATQNFWK